MSNKKKFQQHQRPAPAPVPVNREPTADQVVRIDVADEQIQQLSAVLGPATTIGVAAPALGVTLEEGLRRVELSLARIRSHLETARRAEEAAEETRELLARREAEHDARDAATARQRAQLDEREAALGARDQALSARAAKLVKRELDAEQGFVLERRRVMEPLEADVAQLRKERAELETGLREARRRTDSEIEEREAASAVKMAELDRQWIDLEAAARLSLDEEMAELRRTELARVRALLQAERLDAEAAWERSRAVREAALDERAQELETARKLLRRGEQDLRLEQELLAEDRTALTDKVDRLLAERTDKLRYEHATAVRQLADATQLRDTYFAALESRRELDRRFGERTPEQIVLALDTLGRERDDAMARLRERPDEGATARLRDLEQQRSAWLDQRAVLEAELATARGELATRRLAAIDLEAMRKEKEALEARRQLLDHAVDELRAEVDGLTRQDQDGNPLAALAAMDEDDELQTPVRTTSPLGGAVTTLGAFVGELRHRVAHGVEDKVLHYSERTLRSFLGGLAMTKLILLQGISGTGKTSLPRAFASAVGGGCEVVEVQAGWRDRQDLIGYYNAFHRHYYATNFLQALYRAGTPAYHDRLFFIVLDEINLSRPEQFFAVFLSALELSEGERRLTLVEDPIANHPALMSEGRHLPIPPNVWFVGTANHDETTVEFADKTYDRAHVMEMPRRDDAATFEARQLTSRNALSYAGLMNAFKHAGNVKRGEAERAITWLRKAPFTESLAQRFRVGWGNRLEDQIRSYVPVVMEAGGTLGEAVDHLLASKILRKLKDRHDVRPAMLEDLQKEFDAAWRQLEPGRSAEASMALLKAELTAKKREELT